ncbi:50S ribosomal protein L25 [Blattabacterium cuenoti]|uniref:50S ribosomal protein L25 n=1 Tax=Blattabacterium cuenoti TaxID=1653831 RepID=UPI00163C0C1B|nr:50S ribosomal protein L25 [Blattabacterium cuenoti]
MKQVNIYGKRRDIGKKTVRFLRRSDQIPCILYGKNINIPFSISLEEIKKIIHKQEVYRVVITIENYEKNIHTIRKEVQFDPVNDHPLHVDFYKFDELKPVVLEIPLKYTGRPIGVSKGGLFYSPIKKLKIKSLPKNIPDYIELSTDKLDIGDKITVKHLHNEKYDILHPSNTMIVKITTSRIIAKSSKESENQVKENSS